MQPNPETYSIQRRPMDVEDYIDVVRRHKGWIIGPALVGLVIAVVVAFLWPDTYVSDAMMRIVPPIVPERLVPTNVNLQIGQRLAAMDQEVRSRGNLLQLINTNGLYQRKKGRVPDEDIIEQMRRAVRIEPINTLREAGDARSGSTAFRISFAYDNRYLAQKVVSQIVAMFLDETLRTRSNESVLTTEFLKEKLDVAKKNLDEIENRLTQYKLKFSGKLPEQLQSNLAQLRTLETQLSTASSSINRATQEKLLLENQLRLTTEQMQAAPASSSSAMETAVKNERLLQLERQILELERTLSSMRQQYKESHPDVRRASAQLASLKETRDSLLAEEEKKQAAAPPKKESVARTREQQQLGAELERLQSLIQTKDMEIEQLVKEQARLDKLMKVYQDRIEASPFGEREYAQLTRDYDMAKRQYEDMMLKSNSSAMATDLETRKQGEVLEVLEQASLPQTPAEPNRWFIIGVGASLGLALGVLLAGGMEMKDTSLKNLKDLRAYTGLLVLGSVPLVENDLVVQRKRRLTWLAWSSACIVGFLVMLGSVYYYYTKGA